MLKLSLFGPFEAKIDEEFSPRFATDKVRALLAYLAVEIGQPHRRDTLATLLWPDQADRSARGNLRQTLYQLRRSIKKHSQELEKQIFQITPQTADLSPEMLKIDVNAFRQLITTTKNHNHRHLYLCQPCLDRLKKATNLYKGEMMVGFSLPDTPIFEDWLRQWREQLHFQNVEALNHLTTSYLQLTDFEAAWHYAQKQLHFDNFDENALRQGVMALVGLDRRRAAIDRYHSFRSHLWEELGVEPDPKTVTLIEKIEAGEQVISSKSAESAQHQFPIQFTDFVGREKEIEQIVDLIMQPDIQLLSLVGLGGTGKTRLSIEASHQLARTGSFPDGLYFVDLAPLQTAAELLQAVATAVGLRYYGEQKPSDQLRKFLEGKDLLLVLDNFEHLMDGIPLLQQLLTFEQQLKLIVTTRRPLKIRAETRLSIGGLPDAAAVRLFIQAGKQVRPNYQPDGLEQQTIAQLSQLLEGLPLALEIAAAWLRMMDVSQIIEQVRQNLAFLTADMVDMADHHSSIQAIFEQSWHTLSQIEQTTLAQLSHFQGPFDLKSALTVTQSTPLAVATLLDLSLLTFGDDQLYRLHELVRQYAKEKRNHLRPELVHAAQRRHSLSYLDLLVSVMGHDGRSAAALAQLDRQLANLRRAWLWAATHQPEILNDYLYPLSRFYLVRNLLSAGVDLFLETRQILAKSNHPEKQNLIYELLLAEVDLLSWKGQLTTAVQRMETALEGFSAIGADIQANRARIQLGIVHLWSYNFDLARPLLEKGVKEAEQLEQPWQLAYAQHHLANVLALTVEDEDIGLLLYKQASAAYQELGDTFQYARLYHDMGIANGYYGGKDKKFDLLKKAAKQFEALGDIQMLTMVQCNLGYFLISEKMELAEAEKYLRSAVSLAQEHGDMRILGMALENLGMIMREQGNLLAAARYYREAFLIFQENEFTHFYFAMLMVAADIICHSEPELTIQIVTAVEKWISDNNFRQSMHEFIYLNNAEKQARQILDQVAYSTAEEIGKNLSLEEAAEIVIPLLETWHP